MTAPVSPPRESRLWSWLRYGRGRDSDWAAYLPLSRPPWWSAPARIWRVLTHRRSLIPSPILYFVVGAAGLLFGGILQLAVGLWWWLPPAILLVGTWLFFLSSAWWHRPGTRPISLRIELLQAVNPEKGLRARRREEQNHILGSRLPLFEVEDWTGTAALGSWSGDRGRISHITLAFAGGPESCPFVTVGTMIDDGSGAERVRAQLLGELAGALLQEEAIDPAAPGTIRETHRRIVDRVRALPWTATTIRFDGADREAWQLQVDGHCIAYASRNGFWVTITAPHDRPVALRTITTPENYLDHG